jgi:hypothetical protein
MSQDPTMLPQPTEQDAVSRRGRLFWVILGALAVGQLLAFWMLCSHQVRKAQMRDVSLQVQRVAVADCLQYIPRATLNSCATRVDPGSRTAVMATGDKPAAAADAAPTTMSSAVPVSISYR